MPDNNRMTKAVMEDAGKARIVDNDTVVELLDVNTGESIPIGAKVILEWQEASDEASAGYKVTHWEC